MTCIEQIAATINMPFAVAGGIRTIEQEKLLLNTGADKPPINSTAIKYCEYGVWSVINR
ncbi:MAG: HisA/HisF-related TIM barrel protein, partial [Legionella sp.]